MTGTVTLDPEGAELVIRFPYDKFLVEEVKMLPGRRWDPRAKEWRVPANEVETVYGAFSKHGFEFAPEVTGLLAGTVVVSDKPAEKKSRKKKKVAEKSDDPDAADAFTISQLNDRVREVLRGAFPQPVWVIGEVLDFDKNKDRRHVFFSLVEKEAADARPAAQVDVVLFERTAQSLLPRLEQGDEPLTLRDGLQIRAQVRVDLYPSSGRFQLIIEDIDPRFTLGKLALDREQILRELRDKGLDRLQPALTLPRPPLRVGVLTSPDADGWRDFRKQLEESGFGFQVTLYPVRVQGKELKGTVCAGLAWFDERREDHDVLCIVRGGGSRTDLAWFDDRDVALEVARHPLKILVGIGHQRDRSVLDEIAHCEKTPTATGILLVAEVESCLEDLMEAGRRLHRLSLERVAEEEIGLRDRAHDLRRFVDGRLHRERSDLVSRERGIAWAGQTLVATERHRLTDASQRLRAFTTLGLERFTGRLSRTADALRTGARRILELASARLDRQVTRQTLLDPRRVVARGFALVRDERGRVVTGAGRLQAGQKIRIQMRDGQVHGTVDQVEIGEQE